MPLLYQVRISSTPPPIPQRYAMMYGLRSGRRPYVSQSVTLVRRTGIILMPQMCVEVVAARDTVADM